MNFSIWKDTVELVGIVAIVASLIFVGLQMEQSQQLAFAESAQAMRANSLAESSLRVEHVETWLKGNVGDELDTEERAVYEMLFEEKMLGFFYNWLSLGSIGQFSGVGPPGMARFLYENDGARAHWNRWNEASARFNPNPAGGFPPFRDAVDANLNQLDGRLDAVAK